jgi:DNA topoisomerase-1
MTTHNVRTAQQAGLRYVTDDRPGIARVARGKSFHYVAPNGRRVADDATLKRIRSLAIPPAYRDVWISPDPAGHIQAVGRDARGRKQYRYHARWREVRDEHKYERVIAFAKALPKIRRRTRRDVALPGLPREKVLATVVQVMEKTLIRVGNDEYARDNGSYGLTTMKNGHAKVRAGKVTFEFRGKSGKEHAIELDDPRLARIVKNCRDLPGQELFQYVDEGGAVRDVTSTDVNAYLKDIAGEAFTAKDFRTWAGTVLAAQALRDIEELEPGSASNRNVAAAIEGVAARLGNTRAVCRKCYVHPDIVGAYLDGSLVDTLRQRARSIRGLTSIESAALGLLERRLARSKVPLLQKLRESVGRNRPKAVLRRRNTRSALLRPTKNGDRRPAAG